MATGLEIVTDEGKLFLDSVLDMCSRRIVGFAMNEHHDAELAHAALAMAVAIRGGKDAISGVIMHTDQGSEYTARTFQTACTRMGIKQSMGRVGSALDNAVIESWHSTLEFELRGLERFATKVQARARVAAWIDEFNCDRKHSSIGMRSPIDYELTLPTATRHTERRSRHDPAPGATMIVPSSPASRPSPPGGLRPALTPAARHRHAPVGSGQ
jgi:putative transposase